ncbi:MAG TPA: MBL fold metallo-hydrolase [Rhodanobacteraceae bacterium]|nr:MBL fold metallo-hydrolase [Rhodanobacteraceae bacterium]
MLRLRNLLPLLPLALTCGAANAADTKPFFTLHETGKGIWAAIAVPGSGAGSNSGFIVGDDGVLVVDSFEDPDAAKALLKVIHEKTPLPVRYVVNTHYHLDHVAGNGVYQAAGAVVMAQRNVRAWERTENLKFFGDKITPAQRKMVQSYVLPSAVYRDGIEVFLGHRKIEVRVLPGHTGGDSIVVVPDADVVFTGDLFWDDSLPNLIDADTRAQIHTNDVFLKDYPTASFVPGHGAIGKAADVRAFRDYLVALRQAITKAESKDESGAELRQDVLNQLQATYGAWNYFGHFAPRNIAQTIAELGGKKALPKPVP